VTAEQNKTENTPIAVIPMDSIFTPVVKVNFTVENTRVGQVTDYDKLILEIWTDGSISPKGRRFHRRKDYAGAFEPVYSADRRHQLSGNHG
jgi:DNA-directed RNA polymerase alpha subunit